jgi:hypothetical protein
MKETLENKSYEELLKEITNPKQRLFLEKYPEYRFINHTCEKIGLDDSTVRKWRLGGGVFNHAFTLLKKEVSSKIVDLHEKNIDDVAFNKETPAQSRIFGSLVRLRAEAPDKYREKPTTEHKLTGNIVIQMDIPRPWGKIEAHKPLELAESATKTPDNDS